MQLYILISIFVLVFIAFSIGLNLGLHGVLNTENSVKLPSFKTKNNINLNDKGNVNNNNPPLINNKLTVPVIVNRHDNDNNIPRVDNTLAPIIELNLERSLRTLEFDLESTEILENEFSMNYISYKEAIPILLLTANRPELLDNTIQSLLKVKGVTNELILVAQDGNSESTSQVVNKYGLELFQNPRFINLRGGQIDGATRIAMHYKFALTSAFDKRPNAPAMIIVEDDLLFAPDFYEYFLSVSPILDMDSTTFVVSAWNDNGFKGKVQDPYRLMRTEFFPGLGWLLPRKLYKGELEKKWPNEHWDHWLRSTPIHKNREIIYPQVPRTYHNGIKGTFMNLDTHNRYFKNIDTNNDTTLDWKSAISSSTKNNRLLTVRSDSYEKRVHNLIKGCMHIRNLEELNNNKGLMCLWINVNVDSMSLRKPEFEKISNYFGIWHESKRGGHKNLHEFYWKDDKYILLLNIFNDNSGRSYKSLMPKTASIIKTNSF